MLRVTLFFAFLGPLLGSVGSMCLGSFMTFIHHDGLTFDALVGSLATGLLFGAWGYIIAFPVGVVPAALTGFACAAVIRRRGRRDNLHLVARLLAGAVLGFVFAALSDAALQFFAARQPEYRLSYSVLGPVGGFAGACCAGLIRKRLYDWIAAPSELQIVDVREERG